MTIADLQHERNRRQPRATKGDGLLSDGLVSLLAVLALAVVHLYSGTQRALDRPWPSRALSAGAGIAVSYVFLDLMPALAARQSVVTGSGIFPDLEQHVYVLALTGLAVAFWVETASRASRRRRRRAGKPDVTGSATFLLSVSSFVVLNAAIGYAVANPGDEAVEPLWMFTLAMGLHFLANDHSLGEHHGERYRRTGRWLLAAGLLIGWMVGMTPRLEIRPEALALVIAYIAGGTILNILRHELPDTDRSADVVAFVLGAAVYGMLLLALAPMA